MAKSSSTFEPNLAGEVRWLVPFLPGECLFPGAEKCVNPLMLVQFIMVLIVIACFFVPVAYLMHS